jgi:hypothetical protein
MNGCPVSSVSAAMRLALPAPATNFIPLIGTFQMDRPTHDAVWLNAQETHRTREMCFFLMANSFLLPRVHVHR